MGKYCEEKSVRFLGIWVDETMSFSCHITKLKSKLNSGIYALSTSSNIVSLKVRKLIYRSLVESHLRFGAIVYGATNPGNLEQICVLQRKAIRKVARAKYNAHTDNLFKDYCFLKFEDIVHLSQTIFVRQFKNKMLPTSFLNFFQDLPLSEQIFRDHDYNLKVKKVNKNFLSFYPNVQMIQAWNRNNILIKSEAETKDMKDYYTIHKINSYESECVKDNCYVCNLPY